MNTDMLIDSKQTAFLLGISVRSIYRMFESGELPAKRTGPGQKLWRIHRQYVDDYIASGPKRIPSPERKAPFLLPVKLAA